jgi:hypothetical protein
MTHTFQYVATGQPVTPHDEPTLTECDAESRTKVARWNIGAPEEDGGQRQARFSVHYVRRYGYVAVVTTVIWRDEEYAVSEEYTMSLMKFDDVLTVSATRYSRAKLDEVFVDAIDVLRRRFDEAQDAIVRHFDQTRPTPRG